MRKYFITATIILSAFVWCKDAKALDGVVPDSSYYPITASNYVQDLSGYDTSNTTNYQNNCQLYNEDVVHSGTPYHTQGHCLFKLIATSTSVSGYYVNPLRVYISAANGTNYNGHICLAHASHSFDPASVTWNTYDGVNSWPSGSQILTGADTHCISTLGMTDNSIYDFALNDATTTPSASFYYVLYLDSWVTGGDSNGTIVAVTTDGASRFQPLYKLQSGPGSKLVSSVYFDPKYTSGTSFGMADFQNWPVCFNYSILDNDKNSYQNLDLWVTYHNLNTASTTTDHYSSSTSTVDGIQVSNASEDVSGCWLIPKSRNLSYFPGSVYSATAYLGLNGSSTPLYTSAPWFFSIQVGGLQLAVPITGAASSTLFGSSLWDNLSDTFPFNMMSQILTSVQYLSSATTSTATEVNLYVKIGGSTTTLTVFNNTLLHKYLSNSQMETLRTIVGWSLWITFIGYVIWRIRMLFIFGGE